MKSRDVIKLLNKALRTRRFLRGRGKASKDSAFRLGLAALRFAKVMEDIPSGIFISSLREVRFLQVNRKFESIIGYRKEELVGRTAVELGLCEDTDQCERVRKLLKAKRAVKDVEMLARRKNGDRFILRYSAQRIEMGSAGYILSAVEDLTDREEAAGRIKDLLKERDLLLRELAHRTRNNMQFIISLLDMQTNSAANRALSADFSRAKNRIQSLALVQGRLYNTPDLSRVNFSDFVSDLVAELQQEYRVPPGKINVAVNAEPIALPIAISMPLGLVLNEILTNSIAHAFPGAKKGTITIGLRRADAGRIELLIGDDGVGVRRGMDISKGGSFGIGLVRTLVESQLGGMVRFEAGNGVTCRILFDDIELIR